jgi:hypothetical protein
LPAWRGREFQRSQARPRTAGRSETRGRSRGLALRGRSVSASSTAPGVRRSHLAAARRQRVGRPRLGRRIICGSARPTVSGLDDPASYARWWAARTRPGEHHSAGFIARYFDDRWAPALSAAGLDVTPGRRAQQPQRSCPRIFKGGGGGSAGAVGGGVGHRRPVVQRVSEVGFGPGGRAGGTAAAAVSADLPVASRQLVSCNRGGLGRGRRLSDTAAAHSRRA